MAWPTSAFPTSLDAPVDKTDNVDDVVAADVNGCYDCIENIETYLGVIGSTVTTSVTYKLTNAASANPGHKHTTITADVNHADYVLQRATLKDYGESVNVLGSIDASPATIDITLGNVVTATLATAATFVFVNPSAAGVACSFTLFLTNGGSKVVTWPASVDWPGGVEPTLTAAGVDILIFTTLDGGTIWHGMTASLDSKTP